MVVDCLLCRRESWGLRAAAQPAQHAARQDEGSADKCGQAERTDSASEGVAERQRSNCTSSDSRKTGADVTAASYPSSRSSGAGDEHLAGAPPQAALGQAPDAARPLSNNEQQEPTTAELKPPAEALVERRMLMPGDGSLQDERPASEDASSGPRQDAGFGSDVAAPTAEKALPAGMAASSCAVCMAVLQAPDVLQRHLLRGSG